MKIKTSELTGLALDWAAVIANGVPPEDIRISWGRIYRGHRDASGNLTNQYETGPEFHPSKMWESGGPIIEREGITVGPYDSEGAWWAGAGRVGDDRVIGYEAETPLIAAMRCYVASRLGDEVDVPEELA